MGDVHNKAGRQAVGSNHGSKELSRPCRERGCLLYPTRHGHEFTWSDPRRLSDYNPAPAPPDDPRYPYKYVRVKLGAKCQAPRVRCVIKDKQRMLLRKADGKIYCLKHVGHAAFGEAAMEALRIAEKNAPPKPKKVRQLKDERIL